MNRARLTTVGLVVAALLPALGAAGYGASVPDLPVHLLFSAPGYSPEQPFRQPTAVALDTNNRIIYVADPGAHRVVALSLQGVPAFVVAPGPDFEPVSLAVDASGRLLVSDRHAKSVKVFDRAGKPDSELSLAEAGVGLVEPGRITLDRHGKLYLVDRLGGQVLVFDKARHLQFRFGSRGDREGQFKTPEGIAVDRFGRIYVSDSLGIPVQVFDSAGKYLFSLGRHGEGLDDLSFPTGLYLDRFDQLWLVDTNRHNVIVYDRFGFALRQFGQFGQMSGQLFYPVDLVLDGLGRVYIVEREGRRLQVLTFDSPLDRFSR